MSDAPDSEHLEYKAILEHAGIAIIFTRERRVYRCNRRAEELFGWPPGTLVGQPGSVFYPSPDEYSAVGEAALATLAAGATLELDMVLARRDRSTFQAHLVARTIDSGDKDSGTVWLATDVTRERAEAEMTRRLLREQQLIFERAQIGILFTRDRVVRRCNRRFEEMLGYAPGELIGQPTRIYYPDDAAWERAGRILYAPISQVGSVDDESELVRRDGKRIWCHVTGRMLDPERPEDGYVWLYDDIDATRRTAAALNSLLQEQTMIFERVHTGILFVRDRIIQRCNPRFEEIFGYPAGALIGQPTQILFADDATYQATASRVYAGADADGYDGDETYRHRDGNAIVCHVSGRRVDAARPELGYVWMFEDITARRDAEEALLRSHHEQKLMFDNAMIGIAYQRKRVILRCNRRLEEIFGYPRHGLDGRSTRILFASDAEWEEAGRRAYAADGSAETFDGEIDYLRADGTPIRVHVIGRIVDADTWIWAFEDISARHAAEIALRDSHHQLEQRVAERTAELSRQLHFLNQLIEAIPGPVFYKDRTGRYLGCNEAFARYLNIPRQDLIGKTAFDIAPPELAVRYQAADDALFAHPGSQVYETQIVHADGERRAVMFHKATYAGPDGTVDGLIGVILDITERKRLEERLLLAATVFDSTAEGVTLATPSGEILAVNRAFTEITGYGEDEVVGRNPRLLSSGRHDRAFYAAMWETIAREGRWRGEIWNRRKDGETYPQWLTISAVKDPHGKVTHYVGVFADITMIKNAQAKLAHQAQHDPLTGLPNRLLFEDRLDTALQRARREGLGLALLFIDLDRFKNINDTLGHHVGDSVLCEVSRRFRGAVREADTVARLGGDEFVVLLEGISEPAAASRVADKILDDLRANVIVADEEFYLGASIGISIFPDDGEDAITLLQNADAAMYRAKDRGRNTCEFFTSELTRFSLDRLHLEVGLRHAIDRGELRTWLQPQFALDSGRVVGAEALIRWQHPTRGLVAPGDFIPLAEESGLIVRIGEWILRDACRTWAHWLAQGFDPGILAINVSGVEFRRGELLETVRAVLDAAGLAPQRLELEITESAVMQQTGQSIELLHRLRQLGVHLAIDDFGTGYSSLAYLKRMPLSKLKIDQGFIHDLPDDSEDAAITRAVIALGQSLQLKVIAEGVETEAQREFLRLAGCDEMQGYLSGRPVPVAEFAARFLRASA